MRRRKEQKKNIKVLDRNDQTNNQYDNDEIILLDNSSNDDDNTIIDEDNGEIDDSNMIFDLDDETFHDSIETDEEFIKAQKQHEIDQKNRLAAAKKIQSIQRGRKSRKKYIEKKQAKEAKELKQKRELAATRIQASQRRKSSVKKVQKLKEEQKEQDRIQRWIEQENAATRIAATYKGKQTRRKFEKEKQSLIQRKKLKARKKKEEEVATRRNMRKHHGDNNIAGRPKSRIRQPKKYDYQAPKSTSIDDQNKEVDKKNRGKMSPSLEKKLTNNKNRKKNRSYKEVKVVVRNDTIHKHNSVNKTINIDIINKNKNPRPNKSKSKTKFSPSTENRLTTMQQNNGRKRKKSTKTANRILNFDAAKHIPGKMKDNPPSPQAYIKHEKDNHRNDPKLPMYHVQYGKNFEILSNNNNLNNPYMLPKEAENTLIDESLSQVEKLAQDAMGKMNALQLEVDALQAKVDAEKKMAKSKREKIKKLNMDVEGKRQQFHEWAEASSEFSKKSAILRNIKQRIKIENSEAYLEKQHGRIIRDLEMAQGERQRAMTALDLACSIIRHKKRDMTMFRRLGEELEMLTSELDSFQIPPTILPHGAKYYQTQSSSNATINNASLGGIRMDLRKSAGRSLLHRNDNHTMMKRQARKQNKMVYKNRR